MLEKKAATRIVNKEKEERNKKTKNTIRQSSGGHTRKGKGGDGNEEYEEETRNIYDKMRGALAGNEVSGP